jgi:hypothetical protein
LRTYLHEKEILDFTALNCRKIITKKGPSNAALSDFVGILNI